MSDEKSFGSKDDSPPRKEARMRESRQSLPVLVSYRITAVYPCHFPRTKMNGSAVTEIQSHRSHMAHYHLSSQTCESPLTRFSGYPWCQNPCESYHSTQGDSSHCAHTFWVEFLLEKDKGLFDALMSRKRLFVCTVCNRYVRICRRWEIRMSCCHRHHLLFFFCLVLFSVISNCHLLASLICR